MSEQVPPATQGKAADRRPQAGFLGAVLAVAAAVIAAGLLFAPQVTAHSALSPWMYAGLLGFVLVLAGACVLLAVTLTAGPTAAPVPVAVQSYPDQGYPAQGYPAPAAAAEGRGLTTLGSLLGLAGLTLSALAVVLTVVLSTPTEPITVQFSDLYGRVQLEYCPSLPSSFAATASQDDLVGSATILPVKVTAGVCGNTDYTNGVWIYLNRDAVTVSGRP